ncbi:hypothetical protein [Sphingomonas sp. Marseille-Q8236]
MASRQAMDDKAGGSSYAAATGWRGGFAMAWRWFTAIVGGYGFAVAAAMLTARLLPAPDVLTRVEVTGWPMLLSFLVYVGIGLWALHEIRLRRVSAVIWGGALAMAALIWWLGVRA